MPAPFRADQVGSLLRPPELIEARAARARGELAQEELHAIEDAAVRAAVARQESIGLQAVTDGEFRRAFWHLDFLAQLDGVTLRENPGPKFGGTSEQPPIATVTGPLRYTHPIMVEDFRFLRQATRATAKLLFSVENSGARHRGVSQLIAVERMQMYLAGTDRQGL